MIILLYLFSILLFTALMLHRIKTNKSFGPEGLPLIGNLHQILKNPVLQLCNWAEKYGSIYKINLGNIKAIVVSSAEDIHGIFSMTNASSLFNTEFIRFVSHGKYGLSGSEGKNWQELRRFLIQTLKTIGYGNRFLEPFWTDETDHLNSWIGKKIGQTSKSATISTAELSDFLHESAISSLWYFMTSVKIKPGETTLTKIVIGVFDAVQLCMQSGAIFVPSIRFFMLKNSGYKDLKRSCANIHSCVRQELENHEKTYVQGRNRDLMDTYITHVNNTEDKLSPFHGAAGRENVIHIFSEILIGGSDSSSNTILWSILYLAANPEVQTKLQDEIDQVLGNQQLTLEHKQRMPYADAVILEVLRYSSFAPFGLPHKVNEPFEYKGQFLSKETMIIPLLYHVHFNKSTWGDPRNFRPERFLGTENKHLRRSVVAFQGGKRGCAGEPLARNIIFFYMIRLFQKFYISLENEECKESCMNPEVGFVQRPGMTNLLFKLRNF